MEVSARPLNLPFPVLPSRLTPSPLNDTQTMTNATTRRSHHAWKIRQPLQSERDECQSLTDTAHGQERRKVIALHMRLTARQFYGILQEKSCQPPTAEKREAVSS